MTSATVIVPTVAGGPQVSRLLESLADRPAGVEVLVVDNGSAGRGVRDLGDRFAGVRVIRLESNAGYTCAVNLAAREAAGDALVLLNDDCFCDPGYVEAIVAPLDRAAGVTMVAGVMREARDPARIDTAGMQLDGTLLVFDYLNGEPLALLDGDVPDPIGPSGAAAAFDREAFLAAGGFDEGLFAYWEDVDLVLRMRLGGQRCVLAPLRPRDARPLGDARTGLEGQEPADGLRPRLRASQVERVARPGSPGEGAGRRRSRLPGPDRGRPQRRGDRRQGTRFSRGEAPGAVSGSGARRPADARRSAADPSSEGPQARSAAGLRARKAVRAPVSGELGFVITGEDRLVVALDADLPTKLAVGAGNCLFVSGSCSHPRRSIRRLALAVDGERHEVIAHGMPSHDAGSAPAVEGPGSDSRDRAGAAWGGFWGIVPVPAVGAPRTAVVDLIADLNGGQAAALRLGEVELLPRLESTGVEANTLPRATARWSRSAWPPSSRPRSCSRPNSPRSARKRTVAGSA